MEQSKKHSVLCVCMCVFAYLCDHIFGSIFLDLLCQDVCAGEHVIILFSIGWNMYYTHRKDFIIDGYCWVGLRAIFLRTKPGGTLGLSVPSVTKEEGDNPV